MGTTAADANPAGTNDPAGPSRHARPPKWWEVAVIAATSGAAALAEYALWHSVTTCGDGLECMLNLPIAVAFSFGAPVNAGMLWRVCGIPRPFLLAVATAAIGHLLAVPLAKGFGDGFGDYLDAGPVSGTAPARVYVLIGVVSGLAAIVLVCEGIWSRRIRVGVVALIALLSLAGHAIGERVSVQQHEDRLRAVGVTIYLPDFADLATPSVAWAWFSDIPQHIEINYNWARGADLEGLGLILLATTDGGCGDAERAAWDGTTPPLGSCRATADGFVADGETGAHYVGVTRGQTLLVAAKASRSGFDDAKIADTLRDAPQVSVADLARL
jgi:hypothetical protein